MSDFCTECKAQLEGFGRYCVRCGTDNGEATKKVCPACWSVYNPDALYCSEKGYNLREYNELQKNYDKAFLKPVIGSVIIAVMWLSAMLAAVLFSGDFIINMKWASVFILSSLVIVIACLLREGIIFKMKIRDIDPSKFVQLKEDKYNV